jgi:hypothetical protein
MPVWPQTQPLRFGLAPQNNILIIIINEFIKRNAQYVKIFNILKMGMIIDKNITQHLGMPNTIASRIQSVDYIYKLCKIYNRMPGERGNGVDIEPTNIKNNLHNTIIAPNPDADLYETYKLSDIHCINCMHAFSADLHTVSNIINCYRNLCKIIESLAYTQPQKLQHISDAFSNASAFVQFDDTNGQWDKITQITKRVLNLTADAQKITKALANGPLSINNINNLSLHFDTFNDDSVDKNRANILNLLLKFNNMQTPVCILTLNENRTPARTKIQADKLEQDTNYTDSNEFKRDTILVQNSHYFSPDIVTFLSELMDINPPLIHSKIIYGCFTSWALVVCIDVNKPSTLVANFTYIRDILCESAAQRDGAARVHNNHNAFNVATKLRGNMDPVEINALNAAENCNPHNKLIPNDSCVRNTVAEISLCNILNSVIWPVGHANYDSFADINGAPIDPTGTSISPPPPLNNTILQNTAGVIERWKGATPYNHVNGYAQDALIQGVYTIKDAFRILA